MKRAFRKSPTVIGGLIGLYAGFVFLTMAYASVLGICADNTHNPTTDLLFPLAVYVDPTLLNRAFLVLIVALLQYPLYGIIAGATYGYVSKWKDVDGFIKILTSILPLSVLHLLFFSLAMQKVALMK